MKGILPIHSPRFAIALLAATVTLFTPTPGFTAPAADTSSPAAPDSTPQVQPVPAPSAPTPSPAAQTSQSSKRSDDPMKRDRVSIDEVFPEYCRMYFPSRGTVSLFEYRERMYICLYGIDRWFF